MGVMAVTMRRLVEHVSRMFESETEAGELGADEMDGGAVKGDPEGLLKLEMPYGTGTGVTGMTPSPEAVPLPRDLITETEISLTRAKEIIVQACNDGKDIGEAYELYHEAWRCYVSSRYNKAIHLCFKVQRMMSAS